MQRESLDRLVLRELRVHLLHFLADQFMHPRIGGQPLMRSKRSPLLARRGFDIRKIRNNQGGYKFMRVSDEHGVQNQRARLQRILNRLRRNKSSRPRS